MLTFMLTFVLILIGTYVLLCVIVLENHSRKISRIGKECKDEDMSHSLITQCQNDMSKCFNPFTWKEIIAKKYW